MNNCLFVSVGNNPNLSICNNTYVFYYIGQYTTAFSNGGIVYQITNNGINGSLVSTEEVSLSLSEYKSWCSSYGNGWKSASSAILNDIYSVTKTINATLSAISLPLITGDYWLYQQGERWYFMNMDTGATSWFTSTNPSPSRKGRAVRTF